ncbi:MAG: 30S ribosome-binding factor RbfA [Endomicrobium sp.]|jgi:ribosome-binding factor A|nr:30S ribosome-binding factor RbfA [Endomicrobium sp.]
MPLSYRRSIRVGELIWRTVSEIVRQIRDLNSSFVTILGVKLSNDLLNCKIYYSVLGFQDDKKKVAEILKKNTCEIKHQLALRLNLRRIPVIFFVYDNTNEKAMKVFNILESIENEKK